MKAPRRTSPRPSQRPERTEVMRLPGIANGGDWVRRARIYVAAHRALDEIESAALLAR